MIELLLAATVLVSVPAVVLAFHGLRHKGDATPWCRSRAIALLLFSLGFIIHTSGDYLGGFYGEAMELNVESFAHVIIMAGFIVLLYAAMQALDFSKEYGFKV